MNAMFTGAKPGRKISWQGGWNNFIMRQQHLYQTAFWWSYMENKLHFCKFPTTAIRHMANVVAYVTFLFLTQNVIDHNWDLLDESGLWRHQIKIHVCMMSQIDNKKFTAYRHIINDVIEMIDDEIWSNIVFFFKYLFALTFIGNILINHYQQ